MHLPQTRSFLFFFLFSPSFLEVVIHKSSLFDPRVATRAGALLLRFTLILQSLSKLLSSMPQKLLFFHIYILWILSATTTGFSLRILAAASAL